MIRLHELAVSAGKTVGRAEAGTVGGQVVHTSGAVMDSRTFGVRQSILAGRSVGNVGASGTGGP